jgi:hypothetical protein
MLHVACRRRCAVRCSACSAHPSLSQHVTFSNTCDGEQQRRTQTNTHAPTNTHTHAHTRTHTHARTHTHTHTRRQMSPRRAAAHSGPRAGGAQRRIRNTRRAPIHRPWAHKAARSLARAQALGAAQAGGRAVRESRSRRRRRTPPRRTRRPRGRSAGAETHTPSNKHTRKQTHTREQTHTQTHRQRHEPTGWDRCAETNKQTKTCAKPRCAHAGKRRPTPPPDLPSHCSAAPAAAIYGVGPSPSACAASRPGADRRPCAP